MGLRFGRPRGPSNRLRSGCIVARSCRRTMRPETAPGAGGGPMKPKALVATLAAIAMVSLVACNSDEPSPGEPGHSGGDDAP